MSPNIASTTSTRGTATTPAPCPDPCTVTCPSCGGLQCLCRPRFFAGQLLTDDDLGLLNDYIVEKNKLHNRYLHGWGVVCGMEVVCNPCNNLVTVKTGYALSPCGEDIIVCADTPVDICSLVQKCRKQTPPDCQPLALGANDPCNSGTEDWILFIRYTEKMSRGVMPLKGASGCSCTTNCSCNGTSPCGCGCGGTHGGCGCGGSSKSKNNGNGCSCGGNGTKTQTSVATAPAQCEPTAVCEGYSFDVCKAPVSDPYLPPDPGALITRLLCCFKAILPNYTPPPQKATTAQLNQWCCTIRQNLLNFFAANPMKDCQIAAFLGQMCNQDDPRLAVAHTLKEYALSCFCSVLLPPCPCPVSDDRVPLATITIQKTPCLALRVCNIGVRKFATTFPALQYWFSWNPFVRGLRHALEGVCCHPQPDRKVRLGEQVAKQRQTVAESVRVQPDPMNEFDTFVLQSYMGRKTETIDAQAFAMASLGLTDVNNQPFMTPEELNHPFEAIFLNQVVWPVLQTAVPANLGQAFGSLASGFFSGGAAQTNEVQHLNARIAELQKTVKQHEATLSELEKKVRKK